MLINKVINDFKKLLISLLFIKAFYMRSIQLLAKYNLWADERLYQCINQLDPELLDKEVLNSFNSLRSTVAHLYDAAKIWLARLNGQSLEYWPSKALDQFEIDLWIEQSRLVLKHVESLNEQGVNRICTYSKQSGEEFNQRVEDILLHLFNHATYHRGQIISILHQLAVKNLPATDIIVYLREEH